MNKFAIGALVLTSTSSLAYAGDVETRDWSTLDRDLSSLTSNQGAPAGAFGINGFVRARGARSQDVDVDTGTAGGQDLSGFSLDNARLELNASQGDYGAVIWLEAGSGQAALLEAYGTFKIADGITGQAGRFRAPFLWSSFLVDDNNLVLLDRTFNSQNFQGRQDGAQLSGQFDQFAWWAALQNGVDGVQDKIQWTLRGSWNLQGTGIGHQEGAFGNTSNTPNIMIGAAYSDDEGADQSGGNINSGGAFSADMGLTQGAFSLHAEVVDYQHDVQPDAAMNLTNGVLNPSVPGGATPNTSRTPWSATAGFMITPNQCEVVLRYEDLNDDDNTTIWTGGVNIYMGTHNAKWTLQGSRSDSDVKGKEADTLAVGLTVGA